MELSFSYANQGTYVALPLGAGVSAVEVNGSPVGYTVETGGVRLTTAPAIGSVVLVRYELPPSSFLTTGVWTRVPTVFRLRLVGTGVVSLTAKNGLGVESPAGTFAAANAVNQIEFPFLGDDAVHVMASFPGTLSVEII